jgi:hypothetical protein
VRSRVLGAEGRSLGKFVGFCGWGVGVEKWCGADVDGMTWTWLVGWLPLGPRGGQRAHAQA